MLKPQEKCEFDCELFRVLVRDYSRKDPIDRECNNTIEGRKQAPRINVNRYK